MFSEAHDLEEQISWEVFVDLLSTPYTRERIGAQVAPTGAAAYLGYNSDICRGHPSRPQQHQQQLSSLASKPSPNS